MLDVLSKEQAISAAGGFLHQESPEFFSWRYFKEANTRAFTVSSIPELEVSQCHLVTKKVIFVLQIKRSEEPALLLHEKGSQIYRGRVEFVAGSFFVL